MKALKISLVLIAVGLLTVSVVSKESAVQDDTTTYKEYDSKNKVVIDKKKLKVGSVGIIFYFTFDLVLNFNV